MNYLRKVLCPLCVRPGGLKMFVEELSTVGPDGALSVRLVPVLSCSLPGCRLILMGEIQGGDAVFPDPHVEPVRETGQSS